MNTKIKNFIQFLVLTLFMFFLGCSSELDISITKETDSAKLITLHENFEFVKLNKTISKIITNSQTAKSSNANNKIVQTKDFKIFTNRVTYTVPSDKSRESYSFYIEKNIPIKSNCIENLIFTKDVKNESYRAFIATYFFPDGINSNHKNFELIAFKEINSQTLSIKNLFVKTACQDSYTYIIIETAHDCHSTTHSGIGEFGDCEGGAKPYSTYSIEVQVTFCGDGGGGGLSSPDPTTEGGTTGPTSPNTGNTLPVDTGMTFPSPCQTDDCSDVLVVNEINDLLDKSLDYNQMEWLSLNTDIANEINIFLVQNNTFEGKVFAKEIINQMILNPGLILDTNTSFKSPTNIDRSTITDDTPEGQKFNLVYDALTESPEFKKLFIDLFQDNSRFSVKFEIGNVTNGANGNTNTDLNNPTLNTITISPTFLNNSNKMEIAKTIIHECIHAYLNVKMVDPSIGISIPNLNNMEFCDVVNQQYNDFSPGQNQHNFIYNYMLPTLQTILAQVKDTLVTPADNLTMINDVYVHIPFDSSPSTHFVWNDYYHNLALAGLQDCAFFQNEIGTITIINGVSTPTNTVNQTLMQSYNLYNNLGHQYIHP